MSFLEFVSSLSSLSLMANPLNYNTDNDGDQIYNTNCNSAKTVIKDSAISVCSLNMRSLTVSSDSVKLKRIFEIGHDILVLPDMLTPIDQIKQIKLFWHERVSQYEFYSSNSKYRGYLILIRKASRASASNIHCQDSDTIIFNLSLPGGILINSGPNGDI